MYLDDLKAQLHQQIDACQDEERLRAASQAIAPDLTEWNALPEHVREGILRSFDQVKRGELLTEEEVNRERELRRKAWTDAANAL